MPKSLTKLLMKDFVCLFVCLHCICNKETNYEISIKKIFVIIKDAFRYKSKLFGKKSVILHAS